MQITLGEILKILRMEPSLISSLKASALEVKLVGISPIESSESGRITFVNKPEYEKYIHETKASVVLVKKVIETLSDVIQIEVSNPYAIFARVVQIFHPPRKYHPHIDERSFVSPSAKLSPSVTIFPFVYVGEDCVIGENVVLHPGVVLENGVHIGDDSVLHAKVVVESGSMIGRRVIIHAGSVIGADGFGFAPESNEIIKIPQIGIVVIKDDVEIGACTTIDRAAMSTTEVGEHSKLDSHVHVGHNVKIGHHTMISGMVGLAGSCEIGNHVMIGGHSGVNGHVKVSDRCIVGGMTGVSGNLEKPGVYVGYPPLPIMEWKRQSVYLKKLGEFEKRLRNLESLSSSKN